MSESTAETDEEVGVTGELPHRKNGVLYSVEDTPPWYMCALLGFQHYCTAVGAFIGLPILIGPFFCMDEDMVGISELIGTVSFVSGLVTLLQTTFGVRLPIVQSISFAFMAPTIVIMFQDQWKCEYTIARYAQGPAVNFTAFGLPPVGSDEHREMWMRRIREIQGALMVAGAFQVVIGFSGVMGILLRFIGPLCITPTIALIGLSLFSTAADYSSHHWWIAVTTMILVTLFSQYLQKINIPCWGWERTGGLPFFKLFSILLAMAVVWAICAILTVTDVLPTDPEVKGYKARTDIRLDAIYDAHWFRFPYPGQWGVPTVSVASVFGMIAAVIASMVESIGDYYACARISGAPPPPPHAVNRGLGMEGIGLILTGAWGTGNGTSSFSSNIGAIGITKVGSLRVLQLGAVMMMVFGCFGKLTACFVTIPDPVFGGIFYVVFGMITAVGLANLQHVDLNSSRNIFIIGVSLLLGMSVPVWMSSEEGRKAINTGDKTVDQVITVLLSTSMFVGGVVGFVLDNTIPGTPEERGIIAWRKDGTEPDAQGRDSRLHIYDFPLIQNVLNSVNCFRYIPCCPAFLKKNIQIKTNGQFNMTVDNDIQRDNAQGYDNIAVSVDQIESPGTHW